jgi:hypothetical protein
LIAMSSHVLEHGSTRPGRWLRTHRLRFTLWIAVVEGLLLVIHVLPKWPVFAFAVLAIALWWYAGRRARSDAARQSAWILAASQALVVLIPVALLILGTVAIVAVALIAVAALVMLFAERP